MIMPVGLGRLEFPVKKYASINEEKHTSVCTPRLILWSDVERCYITEDVMIR